MDSKKLIANITTLILNDANMRENTFLDIVERLRNTLKSSRYINHLNDPVVNWLDVPIEIAINSVLDYLEKLSNEIVAV